MKIGIDARVLSRRRTGIENYAEGLILELPKVSPQDSFELYSNRPIEFAGSADQFQRHVDSAWNRVPGSLWLRARGNTLIKRDELDVFWSTYPILPARRSQGAFTVVTVHDLVWLKYPETTSNFNLLIQKLWTEKSIRQADRVIAISRSTQEDLMSELGVPSEKIRMVYPGISERYKLGDKVAAASYISKKYQAPLRYIAALGSVEPRKNFGVLIEAMRMLKERGAERCCLLIAGGSGWKNSVLHEQIKKAGLTEDDVRFLGYVPDEDLQRFYCGALMFLFPSLYEGFGLPPLEAMACGTAVVASNARCMPEVLGDAAVLRAPTDAAGFADEIASLLADEERREELQSRGIVQARKFSWGDSARQLAAIFHEAE